MNTITILADIIFTFAYNIFVLGGTVYLIVERGWSAWWILLAILLLGTWSAGKMLAKPEPEQPRIAVPPFTKEDDE